MKQRRYPRLIEAIALYLLVSAAVTPLSFAAAPPLGVRVVGSNVQVHFAGSLQAASKPEGPYEEILGAISPYQGALTNSHRFWRAVHSGLPVIGAGARHTVALRKDGSAWAWGWNGLGQLGNGTTGAFGSTGTNVPQPILTNATWQAVAAGYAYSAALRSNFTLWVWGDNSYGQLGIGEFGTNPPFGTNSPQPVRTNWTWQTVAAGVGYFSDRGGHTVGIRADGTLWTWGRNNHGQLGTGEYYTSAPYGTNTPQSILVNVSWKAAAAGWAHTLALRSDGTLWAWGWDQYGQLGDGMFRTSEPPYGAVTPQAVQPGVVWRAVSAGYYHSAALRDDGRLWTWGNNYYGQLGNGTLSGSPPYGFSTPQLIETNQVWRAVSAGYYHTAAIRSDGTLWTWGFNDYGQLGNGKFITTGIPQPIQTNFTWQAVAAGERHTAALRSDGTLWAWGSNEYGQLGTGTTIAAPGANTPQPVLGGAVWGTPP